MKDKQARSGLNRETLDNAVTRAQAATGVEGARTGRRCLSLHPPPPALAIDSQPTRLPNPRAPASSKPWPKVGGPVLLVNFNSALKPRLKCHLLCEALSACCQHPEHTPQHLSLCCFIPASNKTTASPPTCCVTLGKVLNLSVPQFSLSLKGHDGSTSLQRFWWGLYELIHIECL